MKTITAHLSHNYGKRLHIFTKCFFYDFSAQNVFALCVFECVFIDKGAVRVEALLFKLHCGKKLFKVNGNVFIWLFVIEIPRCPVL